MAHKVASSSAGPSSGHVENNDQDDLEEFLSVLEEIRTICQEFLPQAAINLSCGHIANTGSLEGRVLCKTCGQEKPPHSIAYGIREIVLLTNQTNTAEETVQALRKIKVIVQDPVTLESLQEAFNLCCGHLLNIYTIVRLNQKQCPICRRAIQNASISPAYVIRTIATRLEKTSLPEALHMQRTSLTEPSSNISHESIVSVEQWIEIITHHINQIMHKIHTLPVDDKANYLQIKKQIKKIKKCLDKMIERGIKSHVDFQIACDIFLSRLKIIIATFDNQNHDILMPISSALNDLLYDLKKSFKNSYDSKTVWQRLKHFICPF
jgi:hypothetical protein